MSAVVTSSFTILVIPGIQIAGDGKANRYQIIGLAISCFIFSASVFFYVDSHNENSHPLDFVAIPMMMSSVGGFLYGIVVLLHSRLNKKNGI